MVIVGIDPSYSSTGVCVWDGRSFNFGSFKTPPTPDKHFAKLWSDAKDRVEEVFKFIKNYGYSVKVFGECPPPSGQFSSGLYGLDFMLYDNLVFVSEEIYNLYPNWLGFLHGTRSYKKSDSVSLCKDMCQKMGITLPRINADQAESCLMCIRGMVHYGESIVECLRQDYPRMFVEKELKLYERKL